MLLNTRLKKVLFFFSLLIFSHYVFSQDFYWEEPAVVSSGEARFPRTVTDGETSYAFWQEIDSASKKIYLSVLMVREDGTRSKKERFAGPFSYSGEIPDLYSVAVSYTGKVAVAALSSESRISTFVSDDGCNSFRQYDFPAQKAQYLAPKIFATKDGNFMLFCSLAKKENLDGMSSILTHNFYLYGSTSPDGLNWTDFRQVFSGEKFKNSFSPVLASTSGGNYLIFQTQVQNQGVITYQLYSSFSERDFGSWSEPVLVSDENSFEERERDYASYDNQLPFAFVMDDEVHIAWERNSSGSDNSSICYARINRDGILPRSAETIADEGNARHVILFSLDDELYASWYAQSGRNEAVFYGKKDGFSWKKQKVDVASGSSKNPSPVVQNDRCAFVWQETYSGGKNRVVYLAPDSTCAKAAISAEKNKAGIPTKNQKVRFKVTLPKDSSGIDGYVYSWSKDGDEELVHDETDLKYPNNTLLNLTAQEEGDWYLKVSVLDRAGNWSETTSFCYSLDLTPPKKVVFAELETDEAGFVLDRNFTIKWSPDESDDDIAGYNYSLSKITGIKHKYFSTPKHPLNLKKTDAADYVRNLLSANDRQISKERRLSEDIRLKIPAMTYRNLDNGLYVFTVSAVDFAGLVGEPEKVVLVVNKYAPLTQILKINKEETVFGDVKIDIIGKDFTVDGTITKIIVDADGRPPYDMEISASEKKYKVTSNERISNVNLGNELDEGSYYVGVVHSDRGLYMTKKAALTIDTNGTVKIENDYDYRPRWRAVTKTYKFRLYATGVLFFVLLVLSAIGIVAFGIEFLKNCRELFAVKKLVSQVTEGVLMDAVLAENKKRKGSLKQSLVGFTISLVVFIIVFLSAILGVQMIKGQGRTLANGLNERVGVLLGSVATGARSYLPSEDDLELSQLPRQIDSVSEAQFITISGFASSVFPGKKENVPMYVWASNDRDITEKIDVLNSRRTSYIPGGSLLSKDSELLQNFQERIKVMNEEAVKLCGEQVQRLSALSAESAKASASRKKEINEEMQNLNIEINGKLSELAVKSVGSIPPYDKNRIDGDVTDYFFYRPVLFLSGRSMDFVRGFVFIQVDTSSLVQELHSSIRQIIYSVMFIALFFVIVGIVSAIIFAVRMVKPISKLEKAVKDISEENNKELLLRNEIKNLPNNEIGRLGESVNRLQRDLGFNARELNLQLNASEIQQGLVPLEPLSGNIKQNISRIEEQNVREFAYYKGAAGVSGDYFDFKKLDDRFYVSVKCDASGHAAPAGILVTIIATLYKKWAEAWNFKKDGTRLNEFLNRANDFLESLNIKGKFVAMVICLYDSKTGDVYMCHAGDKIYRVYDSAARLLNRRELAETPALGPFPTFMVDMKGGFKVEKTKLNSGDILLLYTDGIEENGRAKRKHDFSAIMKPKLDSEGVQISDSFGNLEWEIDKEEFGENRVNDIVRALFDRSKYSLKKEQNPSVGELLEFNFVNCQGTIEECVTALASIEKVFRLYKPASATAKDWVEVDVAIDRFLKEHFNLYETYAIQPKDEKGKVIRPKNPNYIYYAFCKEDVQEDDLTVIAIQRP